MKLADKLHQAAEGKWWYDPLTLLGYWISGGFCLWATVSIAMEGHFDYLWKGLRLLSDDHRTLEFKEQRVAFVTLLGLFTLCSLGFILIGWLKFTKRRRHYLANTRYL